MLQREFEIGYPRAGRLIDQMAEAGIIGPQEGSKPREVLIGAFASGALSMATTDAVGVDEEVDEENDEYSMVRDRDLVGVRDE